ncbi:MAG: hypothetical protein QOE14_113 [Humisphaera sp.]|nr:hypothetical protein [Humisphaera sp.]
MPRRSLLAIMSIVFATFALPAVVARAADADGFEDHFDVKPQDFASTGRNDFFILEPGYQLILEGTDNGKPARLVITVLNETRKVDGVETRIVEERETLDGKPIEVSRNFFAIDKNTKDVYYFGEEVDEYKDGKIAGHPGAWQSGKKGAHYGLMMPGAQRIGAKFYQEIAPKVAMDRSEIVSNSEQVTAPAGEFKDCLKTKETTPLEPDDTEYKLYAKGVGLIVDAGLKLVKHGENIEPRAAAKQQQPAQQAAAKGPGKTHTPDDANVIVPVPVAREALDLVGADPAAEAIWYEAINDPAVSAHDRQDLIEDLNENGFPDPKHVTPDDLPLVVSRLELIEQLAPDAMDDVNADAFAEAYKDLNNMLKRLTAN